MGDTLLLSAGNRNIRDCLSLAQERGLGIEVMTFAFPDTLDGDWQAQLARYRELLEPIRAAGRPLTMHGPFMDLASGSPDRLINAACEARYRHAIQIAQALGAGIVILHANFIPNILTEDYRLGWHKRNKTFWQPIADFAGEHDVTLAIENMWEYDPTIIGDLLAEMQHPHLRACLDVGHAHLFSKIPFEHWLDVMSPHLVHCHLNNNDGVIDVHRAFPNGKLDYADILPRLRALPSRPSMTLELDTIDDMLLSLPYFEL
ncbi:sugar phosphate isomerase/epimerase [Anaerolineae bacterium CFX9]|nr:sugar phosphate isomerase/epimerase [Anaerolineae bacterium CFX9]